MVKTWLNKISAARMCQLFASCSIQPACDERHALEPIVFRFSPKCEFARFYLALQFVYILKTNSTRIFMNGNSSLLHGLYHDNDLFCAWSRDRQKWSLTCGKDHATNLYSLSLVPCPWCKNCFNLSEIEKALYYGTPKQNKKSFWTSVASVNMIKMKCFCGKNTQTGIFV